MPNSDRDLRMVDELCRMQLEARRRGCLIVLCDPRDALRELIEFVGLREILLGGETTTDGPREEQWMSLPEIVSETEWLQARKALLVEEKAMTRARDALNRKRRELPMVKMEKRYVFDGPDGRVELPELFEGRRQLIVQHFMFDPNWDEGCPSCTTAADEMSDGLLRHLRSRDTTFAVVSRAPLEKLERYKAQRGWTFPWYSSHGSDFNYDFHVTIDGSVAPIMWNYRTIDELRAVGLGWLRERSSEQPGYSAFLRVGDDVFHTYSTYARGAEQLGGAYAFLDMTALGRQEDWEEPRGRAEAARGAVPNFAE